ncbi:TTC17-like protein [Mya arenaria]|uniref:TTC17-like protein n=1 Tax=Mya arenaria TaxID=6604 RepID=A0ABY7DU30_MYAAR|nr:TTC17-like protein [Mya arenaria]
MEAVNYFTSYFFRVKLLLTEALGLKEGDEHPLPWYPPVCVTLLDIPEGNTKSYDHVHSVSQEQRKTNSGPKWILFNLAGLYWRIIGNNYHAIECFRRSIYTSPIEVQDVSEVNLANVLYRWGRYEDARVLNYSGAVYRYELALEAEPEYTDVTNTLRALKCFLKFYQAQQSVAPNEENGEEKCVLETRTRKADKKKATPAKKTLGYAYDVCD